jgi:hypothetical protein
MEKPNKVFLAAMFICCIVIKVLPFVLQHFGLNIGDRTIYPWSFTPIFAWGLFGVAMFRDWRLSFGLPLLAWLIADVLIGVMTGMASGWSDGVAFSLYPGQAFTYVGLLVVCGCGFLIRLQRNWLTVGVAALLGPTLFYLLTNFGAWYFDMSGSYAHDWTGLVESYRLGLPFYRNHLISTVGFSALLFSPLGLRQLREQEIRVAEPVPGSPLE